MYRNFRGKIVEVAPARCMSFGEVALLDDDMLEVTELPPQIWTDAYKEKLMKMMGGTDEKGKDLPKLIEVIPAFKIRSNKIFFRTLKTIRATIVSSSLSS